MKAPGTTEWAAIPPQWEWHYRMLSRLRDILVQERDARYAALREAGDSNAHVIADMAEAETEREEVLAELAAEQHELNEIEAALARIRAGTYGICEATGWPIALDRLRVSPWARCALTRAVTGETHTSKPDLS